MTRLESLTPRLGVATTLGALMLVAGAAGAQWTHWRGPNQDGSVAGQHTVDQWSTDGTNLAWRADFAGRSTPVVVDGRVCAIGRAGEDELRQEAVACWDAASGKQLWQKRYTVSQTDVPWNRVGWANLAADAETGYVYAHTVDGLLIALDKAGYVKWQWSTAEDLGRLSGYGGRTHSPIVDEDRVILGMINSSWGAMTPPRHRYVAFDKKNGEILWISTPGEAPAGDLNTQSTPVIATIGGRRLMIGGNADGWVYAIDARSGVPVWKFHLSKRGLNASVAVLGDTVFASHSEENLDEGTQGRLVAIDGSGHGDVTASHEKWRSEAIGFGFPSPLIHGGRIYLADNSANLHCFDAASGRALWVHELGTVGKASPVWADGKIYVTEVNGNVLIVEPGDDGAKDLDKDHIKMPDGRYAEVYGSPAVAYDRVFFTTEEGIYALGDKSKPFAATAAVAETAPAPVAGEVATIQVVPAELVGTAGDIANFRVRAFDAKGLPVQPPAGISWSLGGLGGSIAADGALRLEASGVAVGTVTAKAGALESSARVLIAGALPWREDFESLEIGKRPAQYKPGFKGAAVTDLDGNKVLTQPKAARGAPRGFYYLGPGSMSGYTLQADVLGGKQGRRFTDIGLINGGYTFDLQGAYQRLEIRSWGERRLTTMVDFPWDVDTWYTLKVRVDTKLRPDGNRTAIVRGKAWKRGEAEPEAWTITHEDPIGIPSGAPGLYTFAPVDSHFDNVFVTRNE